MRGDTENEGRKGLRAVIVGIDGYEGLRALRCATNDAVSVREVLLKVWPEGSVKTYLAVWPREHRQTAEERFQDGLTWGVDIPATPKGVTRDGIIAAVKEATARARPEETFLFYFAGHGKLVEGQPAIAIIEHRETGKGVEFVPLRCIQEAAERWPNNKRVIILDCCLTEESASHAFFEGLRELACGWSVFTSCSPGERSLEDTTDKEGREDYLEQGLFTASIVRGLRGEASQGRGKGITLLELATFVANRVQIESEVRGEEHRHATVEKTLEQLAQSGSRTLGPGPLLQHPVLLADGAALGGPFATVLAPRHAFSKQDLRRPYPSAAFWRHLKRFLFGPWPFIFTRRLMFRYGGAVLYGATILLTIPANCHVGSAAACWTLGAVAGVISALLWWFMIAFAAAANEDGWHAGGYATAIGYLVWHAVLLALSGALLGADRISGATLALDLFVVLCAVVIFGCNASQAIIALAEPLRSDARREIREAIVAFRQFRRRVWHVDLFNLIACVSSRPGPYFFTLGIVLVVSVAHTIYAFHSPFGWVALLRNLVFSLFAAWQAFWYSAAFQFLQREVYKR